MINRHLSDNEIQQYVSEPGNCNEDVISHIHSCEYCLAKAETYRLIFFEIEQQPKETFNFDLSAIVLEKISQPEISTAKNFWNYYLITGFVVAGFGYTIYLYRAFIKLFFKKHIFSIASGLSTMIIYLVITTIAIISIFQIIEMYRRYQKKINDLNFY